MHTSIGLRHCRAFLCAAAICAVLLFHTTIAPLAAVTGVRQGELPACEQNETLFPRTADIPEGETLVDQWAKTYHSAVSAVIEAHLTQMQNGGTCDETVHTEPSEPLAELAGEMGRENIHEEDMQVVLLNYLHEYECALQTESYIAEGQVYDVLSAQRAKSENAEEGISIMDFAMGSTDERRQIERQLAISAPAMHEALLYVSGFGRLQPLTNALQCLAGATVDIRNALDLSAEASACLPRIWDARTGLRMLTPEPTE